jgi:hypothetical protein
MVQVITGSKVLFSYFGSRRMSQIIVAKAYE